MDGQITKAEFDLQNKKLTELTRQETCQLGSLLCEKILEESGNGTYHGGIYPENIETATNSIRFLKAGSKSDWTPQELNFTAPEVFWNGETSPRSDVYSLGMLLYYCTAKGRLPFAERGGKVAARSRMEGEVFDPPRGAGARLGTIIRKATAFRPQDRYVDLAQLKIVLDSCLENRLVGGTVSGETVFGKEEEQLSDVERMMLSIIVSNDELNLGAEEEPEEEILPEEEPAAEETGEAAAEEENEPAEMPAEEILEPIVPAQKDAAEEEAKPEEEPEQEQPAEEPEKPETKEPPIISAKDRVRALEIQQAVEEDLSKRSSVSYRSNVERERQIAEKIRARRRRPLYILAALSTLLIALAIMVNAFKGYSIFSPGSVESNVVLVEMMPGVNVEGTVKVPDPDPTPDPEPTPEPTPEPEPTPYVEPIRIPDDPSQYLPRINSDYDIFVEDVSWTEAVARCEARGGHLVVINDTNELNRVIELAQRAGINYVWIGCERVDGEFRWVTRETVDLWPWDRGEPSGYDGASGEAEDFVLLWNHNGVWCYNDMCIDPAGEYAFMYSGKIAYVCEYN